MTNASQEARSLQIFLSAYRGELHEAAVISVIPCLNWKNIILQQEKINAPLEYLH